MGRSFQLSAAAFWEHGHCLMTVTILDFGYGEGAVQVLLLLNHD